MPFKAKAYPFPVLSDANQNYEQPSTFEANISLSLYEADGKYAPKASFDFRLDNAGLMEMLQSGIASLALEIYSPETMTRRIFKLSEPEGFIDLSNLDIAGTVEVSPLIVMNHAQESVLFVGISDEYGQNPSFDLKKGDPLAIASTQAFEVEQDHSALPDLLTVKRVKGAEDHYYEISTEGNVIMLLLSEKMHDIWQLHSGDPGKKPYLFAGIYKECIEAALEDLFLNHIGEREWAKTLHYVLEKKKLALNSIEQVRELSQKLTFNTGYERILSNVNAS